MSQNTSSQKYYMHTPGSQLNLTLIAKANTNPDQLLRFAVDPSRQACSGEIPVSKSTLDSTSLRVEDSSTFLRSLPRTAA